MNATLVTLIENKLEQNVNFSNQLIKTASYV